MPQARSIGAAVLVLAVLVLGGAVVWRNGAGSATASAAPSAENADVARLKETGAACFDANAFACAVSAYARAASAAPGDAGLWAALGEARVMASEHDPMPADALDAFRKAAALDPKNPRARYFLAANRDLGGDHAGAIGDWLALLADTPAGAPWEKDLRRTIEQVGRINHIDVASRLAAIKPAPSPSPAPAPGLPGPSADDLAAATAIPPSQQRAMAEAMVDRLETRLASDPHNPQGWIMLMRSRVHLDQRDRALAALKRALDSDPADAAALHAGARENGLE